MFPPVPGLRHRRRLRGLRDPLEPDPRRLRRRGGAVRARGAPERDRLRLLDERAHPRGDRPPPGVRLQLGPVAHDVAGHRPGRVHRRLRGPDLPRRLQGHPDAARRTVAPGCSARTCRGATRAAAGTSSRPVTATCRGRTPSARSTRSATPGRSRSSGRTPAWTACTAPRRPSGTCGRCSGRCPTASFDAAFSNQ